MLEVRKEGIVVDAGATAVMAHVAAGSTAASAGCFRPKAEPEEVEGANAVKVEPGITDPRNDSKPACLLPLLEHLFLRACKNEKHLIASLDVQEYVHLNLHLKVV